MKEPNIKKANISDLVPDDKNFNRGSEYGKRLLDRSFEKFGAGRSILIDKNNRIIAGNKASESFGEGGGENVLIVETDGRTLVAVKRTDIDLDSKAGRELALADNATQKADLSWDTEVIEEVAAEWDIEPEDWGVGIDFGPVPVSGPVDVQEQPEMSAEEVARKQREFEERMAAGEISEEDPEYLAFVEKFKLKKTTDDCYTPAVIHDAVIKWVSDEYDLNPADFVRPFYPGGDYENENYAPGAVVVDNPPFSIMADILRFYQSRNIKFFLYAPSLTLFSSSADCCALPVSVSIIYDNGANINTSFLTNLEPRGVRLKSAPSLYRAVTEANKIRLRELHKDLPKYSYDPHIITAAYVSKLSRLGVEFSVPRAESVQVSELDNQKAVGKQIFGKGYLVSDHVVADRERADRERDEFEELERRKQSEEETTRWELSDRERALVAGLNQKREN